MVLRNPEHQQIPIVQTAYQLTLRSYLLVGACPKPLRLTFQERLSWTCHDILEDILSANHCKDLQRRQEYIKKIAMQIPALRLTMRLAFDLKCLAKGQLSEISQMLEDVQHQLAAWDRWHEDKIKAAARQKPSYSQHPM